MTATMTLSKSTFKRLVTIFGDNFKCQRCGLPLQKEEKVIKRNGKNGTHHYHEKCWDSMFM